MEDGDDAASDSLALVQVVALEARATRGILHLARESVLHAPEHRPAVHEAVPLVARQARGRDHQPTRGPEASGRVPLVVAVAAHAVAFARSHPAADVAQIGAHVWLDQYGAFISIAGPCVILVVFPRIWSQSYPISVLFLTVSVGDGPVADVCADEGATVVAKAVIDLQGIAGGRASSQVLHTHLRERGDLVNFRAEIFLGIRRANYTVYD